MEDSTTVTLVALQDDPLLEECGALDHDRRP